MKSGKDEEKTMGPMFPRLHVNDTERGGPRAPPRNKMALYEQLSIPSQRFNSRQPLTSPVQHNNSRPSVLPATSSQGGPERSVVSPFYITPSTPAHSTEKLHSNSSDGVNLNTKSMDFEQKSMENRNYRTSNATGPMFSTAEGNSFHPNNSFGKKVGDEDDYVVPTFVHYGNTPLSSKDQPMQQIARDKLLKQNNPVDLNSAQRVRNPSEENQKDSMTYRECVEKPNSHCSTRETFAEPLKHTYVSSNQEQQNSPVGNSGRFYSPVAELHQEYRDGLLSGNTVRSGHILVQPMEGEKENSRVRINPCSRSSFPSLHVSHNEAENGNEYYEDQVRGSLQVGDVDRNDDLSETSMVDSISALDISPDDVVGVIGQKHFWKARRAIVNQQRVFAVQVFELHRLIKVQQLIAGSPHLLLEDNPYLGKPSLKVSPAKKLPLEYVIKSPPRIVKQSDYQKPNQRDGKSDNAVKKFPLPSLSNDPSQGLRRQNSNCEPYSGNQPPPSITNDTKTGPWCFHPPPGNQWLVPVMSPSEGLIYKPYGGPCPPNAGFMAPLYGGCRPLSVPSTPGDFLPPVYGIPAPHQQGFTVLSGGPPPGQTYFSPYGMPAMSPVMTGAQPHGRSEQLSTGNFERETISSGVRRFRTSKESEIQGSTASSPSERSQGGRVSQITEGNDALPLFPTDPVTTGAHSGDQRTRVIKVVPHNPRSATESAARIFRSIQAERLQHESE